MDQEFAQIYIVQSNIQQQFLTTIWTGRCARLLNSTHWSRSSHSFVAGWTREWVLKNNPSYLVGMRDRCFNYYGFNYRMKMLPSHFPPARKRELTIFDLPPIANPKFQTHIRKPSLTIFNRQYLSGNNFQKSKNKVILPKAHLRLREMTESNLGTTRSLTDSELHKIALDYLSNRSKSTDSWFHQKQVVHTSPRSNALKPEVSDAFTQLSTIPPITSHGEPLLRRPDILQSRPISEGGDVFRVILKNKELMPFSFQGDLKMARDFYDSHYPLLMRKTIEKSPPNSRRVSLVTEELVREYVRQSSAERRAIKMAEKSKAMEEILKELEDENGENIVTELRDDVFNPLQWPWNKNK